MPGGETGEEPSGWTVDTLLAHVQRQIDDLRVMLDERYATQTKAVDAAFVAQQTAMRTALDAAEKAVATAMTAAEKAVTKAETAAEKRFEATNEFRGQLSDQAATFITRTEAEAVNQRNVERISELQDRMNRSEGQSTGLSMGWAYLLGGIAALGTLVALAAAFLR